jgi:peroxiredoxin
MVDRWRILRLVIGISASVVAGVAVFVAAVTLLMMISASVRSAASPLPLAVGSPAPYFELPDVDGNPVRLTDFHGKPVIVVFWADWCPDCKAIVPDLNKLYAGEAAIVGINLMESKERVSSAVDEGGMLYPVLLDRDGAVGRAYGVQAIPNIFLLDGQGRLVEHRYTVPETILGD